jgi:hypothetical protein
VTIDSASPTPYPEAPPALPVTFPPEQARPGAFAAHLEDFTRAESVNPELSESDSTVADEFSTRKPVSRGEEAADGDAGRSRGASETRSDEDGEAEEPGLESALGLAVPLNPTVPTDKPPLSLLLFTCRPIAEEVGEVPGAGRDPETTGARAPGAQQPAAAQPPLKSFSVRPGPEEVLRPSKVSPPPVADDRLSANLAFAVRLRHESLPTDSKAADAPPNRPPVAGERRIAPTFAELRIDETNVADTTGRLCKPVKSPAVHAEHEEAPPAAQPGRHESDRANTPVRSETAPPSAAQFQPAAPAKLAASTNAQSSARAAEPPQAETHQDVASPTPVRDISVRLSGSTSERVDLRISERTGDISLTVRSSDLELTRQLRDGLPELTDRLERSGYQAEVWRPQAVGAGAETGNGRAGDSESRHSGLSQRHGGDGSNPHGRDRHRGNQPRWVEELEARFAPGRTSEL